jgi:hypothetical protein
LNVAAPRSPWGHLGQSIRRPEGASSAAQSSEGPSRGQAGLVVVEALNAAEVPKKLLKLLFRHEAILARRWVSHDQLRLGEQSMSSRTIDRLKALEEKLSPKAVVLGVPG